MSTEQRAFELLHTAREWAAMLAIWALALFSPLIAVDTLAGKEPVWPWVAMGLIWAFFVVQAVLAARNGSSREMILWVVVPISLAAFSFCLYLAGLWDRLRQWLHATL